MSGREPARPDPARRAVALRYDRKAESSTSAPRVVAKGRAHMAERILELASRNDVPVREDADLVQLLSGCELGDEIPVEVYGAVAELFAWLYRVNGELGSSAE